MGYLSSHPSRPPPPYRSGARSTSYRLHNLQEALSLAFEAAAPAAPGQPPAHLGYRVHIHREEAKVCTNYGRLEKRG